jgi:hypothetical protein
MKKLFFFFLISISLLSCQKQKQTSIIGGWLEVSAYTERNGQYSWGSSSRFPLKLSFSADGKYNAFYDVSAGNGSYSYDYSNKELQIQTINPISNKVYTISYLSDNYLIIDYSTTYKIKFVRL